MEFFDTSTRNLLAAEKAAGVGHHVALSVVGADRMPDSGYMRAKVNQEGLIEAGGVPYTIVRATQFFEFLGGIAGNGDGDSPPADRPHAAAGGRRRGGRPGRRRRRRRPRTARSRWRGPESLSIAEFVGRFLAASGDKRKVVADPQARYFGAALDDRGPESRGRIRSSGRRGSRTGSVAGARV